MLCLATNEFASLEVLIRSMEQNCVKVKFLDLPGAMAIIYVTAIPQCRLTKKLHVILTM